jgi:crotonobetainyl-CoA:carnitine CoA-transferase CaiB-like acyl-CoA transferase
MSSTNSPTSNAQLQTSGAGLRTPDASRSGPLQSIRVIECGNMVSAPYAAKLMADLGAEVIKVESPAGDASRRRGPYPGNVPHPEKSGTFLYLNTNKLGVTLNLEVAKGQEILHRLVKEADLVIHNYHPTRMAEVGMDYDILRQINPRVVMTSISPFGQTGPNRNLHAQELTMWSAGGIVYLGGVSGRPDMPPLKTFGQQAGFQGGVNAANGSLAALFGRFRSGKGQHVDISVQECLVAIMENNYISWPYDHSISSRLGFRLIPQDVFQCRDGFIYFLAIEDHQWKGAVELMGNPDWAAMDIFQDFPSRSANWDVLKTLLEEWMADKSLQEVYHAAQARRVPFAPVSTMGDLINSKHLNARGFFAEISHPQTGNLKYPGAPYRFSATPWALRRPAPCLGQHNSEVYGRIGLSQAEINELKQQGTI